MTTESGEEVMDEKEFQAITEIKQVLLSYLLSHSSVLLNIIIELVHYMLESLYRAR